MKNGIGKYNKHYYTGNHLSSTQLVTDASGVAAQQVEYAPFGEVVNEYNSDWSSGQVPDFKFNGKELDEESGMYYFEARYQRPPVFISRDVMFEKKPWMSGYAYCSNSPTNRIDIDGRWDIKVTIVKGYGTAIVTDRHGNKVFRFQVRAEGAGGHDRMKENNDTPYGTYDIPDKGAWLPPSKNRGAYGPNYILIMIPESGEALESGRSLLRTHGGRQEKYDQKTGQWVPVDDPVLKKTLGCLRACDDDMKNLKNITDQLQANDKDEIPGKVIVSPFENKSEATPTKTEPINEKNEENL
jgi:RHS repeat-associated protein